jgi:hypothetical protein
MTEFGFAKRAGIFHYTTMCKLALGQMYLSPNGYLGLLASTYNDQDESDYTYSFTADSCNVQRFFFISLHLFTAWCSGARTNLHIKDN